MKSQSGIAPGSDVAGGNQLARVGTAGDARVFTCKRCGEVHEQPSSKSRTYCDACQPIAKAEYHRAYNAKWRDDNRQLRALHCARCGADFHQALGRTRRHCYDCQTARTRHLRVAPKAEARTFQALIEAIDEVLTCKPLELPNAVNKLAVRWANCQELIRS